LTSNTLTRTPPTDARPARALRQGAFLGASAAALVLAAIASVCIGATTVPLAEIWRSFVDYQATDQQLVIRDVRVPRTVLAVCVGAALAVAGALVQTLTRNPLAEPGMLGVTFGAGFAIILGAMAGISGTQGAQLGLGMAGAVIAAVMVYLAGRSDPLRLLLAGVALSAVLQGLSLVLRLMDPDVLDEYRFWAVGALAGREQLSLALPLTAIALSLLGALAVSGALNAMALGENVAHALGAHVVRTRILVLLLVTVLAGAATAICGPVAFVGLMVPHVARRLAGGSIRLLLAHCILLGPVLMLIADIGSRVLLPTGEVPVAIVTAFLGGPVLIWAVRRYGTAAL
jgi:iron complex transport system permease protein